MTSTEQNEQKFDYCQERDVLGFLLYPMCQVSDILSEKVKDEADYPEITLYCKFVLTAVSLARLLPEGEMPKDKTSADVASIASLARNMVEIYNFFYYLCLDDVSAEELDFRRLSSFYHFICEHHRVGGKMEVPDGALDANKRDVVDRFRAKLQNHVFFGKLPGKKQKEILKGSKPMYLSRVELTRKYCETDAFFDALYKVMSNHVHSGVFGLIMTYEDAEFGCDSESNREKIAPFLYLVNYYVGLMICSLVIIYPDYAKQMPKGTGRILKGLINRF